MSEALHAASHSLPTTTTTTTFPRCAMRHENCSRCELTGGIEEEIVKAFATTIEWRTKPCGRGRSGAGGRGGGLG